MHILNAANIVCLVDEDSNVHGLPLNAGDIVAPSLHRGNAIPGIKNLHIRYGSIVSLQRQGTISKLMI